MKAGSLRRRKNGTWQYRASYGTRPNGQPISRSTSFPAKLTQTEAETAARKIRTRWDDEQRREVDRRHTLAYLIDEWEEDADHSPNTTARYVSIVGAIRRDLGHIRLADLSARDLDRWYKDLAREKRQDKHTGQMVSVRSPNTIIHYHRTIRGILQQGYDWDMLDRNVADKARPPKSTEIDETAYVPTIEALVVILGHASRKARLGILLAASTGCREGEIVGLRWSDLTGTMLHVRRSVYKVPGKPVGVKPPKNGKSKRIPLPPAMLEELARHRVWQLEQARRIDLEAFVDDDGYVLAKVEDDPTGHTPFAPQWLAQEWERANKKAGTAFKFHGLRHMHGTLLVDAGIAPTVAAQRQGQSLEVFQARYAHALESSVMEAAVAIGEITAPLFANANPERARVSAQIMGPLLAPQRK